MPGLVKIVTGSPSTGVHAGPPKPIQSSGGGPKREPGLPTAEEDEVVRKHTKELGDLRTQVEARKRAETSGARDQKIDRARNAAEAAKKRLDAIEAEAAARKDSDLLHHLEPLEQARADVARARGNVGRRIDTGAVAAAGSKVSRRMAYKELEAAIGRGPDVVDLRLDPQGLVIPERSIAAHVTIRGGPELEARFANGPRRQVAQAASAAVSSGRLETPTLPKIALT